MVIISNGEQTFDVEDRYASYSPYLSGAMDMIEKSKSEVGEIVIEGVESDVLSNYLKFLVGDDFTMTREDDNFFQFMGHPNLLRYPPDYWKLKLRSRWIRENFYKYNLCERDNGLYGLVPVPIFRSMDIRSLVLNEGIDTERDGVVIAGGAALYSAGVTRVMNDIDLFSLNKEKSMKWFFGLARFHNSSNPERYYYSCLANSFSVSVPIDIDKVADKVGTHRDTEALWRKVTLIRRLYKCPVEVVHGFDLDASQFILVYTNGTPKLYATELGIYAAKNKVNWVDPDMASTTYLERLAKYRGRGFQVKLPLIKKCNITMERVFNDIGITSLVSTSDVVKNMLEQISVTTSIPVMRDIILDRDIPHDLGSILIYIAFFDLSSSSVIRALRTASLTREEAERMSMSYESPIKKKIKKLHKISDVRKRLILLSELQEEEWQECKNSPWITVDPMAQAPLTGVIYPLTIVDLRSIYKESPFYKRC